MPRCDRCLKDFSSRQRLEYHLSQRKSLCQEAIGVSCDFCNKRYSRLDGLSRHETTCSKNPNKLVKSYECPRCSETYTRKDNLSRHMSTRCNECIGMKLSDITDMIASVRPKLIDNSTNNIDKSNNTNNTTNNIKSNNTTNNITNNITKNKNITNITLQGQECTGHVTDKFMRRLPKDDVVGSCVKYIEKLFFDKDVYENHKFLVSNINRQDGGIEFNPKTQTLLREITKGLMNKYIDISLKHMCRYYANRRTNKKISEREEDFYDYVSNIYFDEDPNYSQARRELIEQVKLSAYNHKRIPRDTFDEFIRSGVLNSI